MSGEEGFIRFHVTFCLVLILKGCMNIRKRIEAFLFLAVAAGEFFASAHTVSAQQSSLTSCSFSPSSITASDSTRRPRFYWTWNGSGSSTATVKCTIHTPTFVTTPFPTVTYTGQGTTGILLNKISEGIGGTYMTCRVNGIECPTTLPIVAYGSSGGGGDGGGSGSYGSVDVPNPIDPECKFSPNPISVSATSLNSTFSWKGDSSAQYELICVGAELFDKRFSGASSFQQAFSFAESARGKQETCRVVNLSNNNRIVCQNVTLGIGSNASCSSQVCVSGSSSCTNGVDNSGTCDGGKVCCKAVSTSTSCSGKDSSGATRTGTCSSSSSCSSGEALSGASGCATSGSACCYDASSNGACESTSGQKCSANCSQEIGYEVGGTGTCSDSTKPQCCKSSGKDTSASVGGGLVPCGNSGSPCTLCHLFLLVKNIFDWIFRVMVYIGFAVLVAMGILYIVSVGNTQLIGMAKKGIWASLTGFAVVLLGWVAINVVLMVLADGTLASGTATFSIKTNGSWFEFNCDTTSKYLTGASGTTSGTPGGTTGGGPGNGTCSVISSGYCTTDNLGKACSWNAEAASKVCNVESGGNTSAASNTDRCQNESGDRFSFGLFQLNIIANGCMLGSDCCWQNVFSLENGNAGNNGGRKKTCTNSKGVSYVCGWGCSVINRTKYAECSQRAMDAAKNIEAACTLYKKSGWSPWPVTKKTCGL